MLFFKSAVEMMPLPLIVRQCSVDARSSTAAPPLYRHPSVSSPPGKDSAGVRRSEFKRGEDCKYRTQKTENTFSVANSSTDSTLLSVLSGSIVASVGRASSWRASSSATSASYTSLTWQHSCSASSGECGLALFETLL
eukprot:2319538-Amphidinium_carterae.1